MQGDDPNNSLFNPPPVLPASSHDNTPVLKAVQAKDGGQQEGKEEKEKEIQELKDKIDKRKKELEEARKKFQEFKEQVESATGESTEKVKKQGNIGQKALKYAKELGVNGSYSVNDGTNTNDFVKKVIDDALKNIEEELEKLAEPQNIEDKK